MAFPRFYVYSLPHSAGNSVLALHSPLYFCHKHLTMVKLKMSQTVRSVIYINFLFALWTGYQCERECFYTVSYCSGSLPSYTRPTKAASIQMDSHSDNFGHLDRGYRCGRPIGIGLQVRRNLNPLFSFSSHLFRCKRQICVHSMFQKRPNHL